MGGPHVFFFLCVCVCVFFCGGLHVGCRLKFHYFVGRRLIFSTFVGCR